MRITAIALTLVLCGSAAFAEQKPKQNELDPMLQMYVDAAKPVPEHARLDDLTGKWKIVMKLWFDPGAAPVVYSGSGTGKMILGGRFLELRTNTSGQGIDTESLTILGFDRRTSDYTMVGYDTLGTYYIAAAGKYDNARKMLVMNGSYLQPPANAEVKYRFELVKNAKGDQVWTLFFDMGGSEVRVAESTYTKVTK